MHVMTALTVVFAMTVMNFTVVVKLIAVARGMNDMIDMLVMFDMICFCC